MASKSKQSLKQVSMYPKDLVYPPGEEFQLEMIRARRSMYQERLTESLEDHSICDMDMTEAFTGNITLNIPVMRSVERGKTVNVLLDKPKEQADKRTALSRINEDALDEELDKLCLEKDNSYSHEMSKGKNDELTDDKVFDMEREFQQLISEEDSCSHNQAAASVLASKENLYNQENEVPKRDKPLFQFTPSATEDSSLASWHGTSAMPTCLNFSEADSVSVSSVSDRNSRCLAEGSKPKSFLDFGHKGHLTREQQLFEDQFTIGYTEMEMKKRQPLQECDVFSFQRKPLGVAAQHKQSNEVSNQSVAESFSVYEEPSVSSFLGYNAKRKTTKHDSISSQGVVESFSVFNDPSQLCEEPSEHSKASMSQRALESFSVFEEPSITDCQRHSDGRKPFGIISQDTSQSRLCMKERTAQSFSVFEDPSISESFHNAGNKIPPTLRSSYSKDVSRTSQHHMAEGSVFEDPSTANSRPQHQQENTSRNPLAVPDHTRSFHRTAESFSVFEDPSQVSMADPNRLQQQSDCQSGMGTGSFGVSGRPSQGTMSVTDPAIRDRHSKGAEMCPSAGVLPYERAASPDSFPKQLEMPGFTEFDIPSYDKFEPTSTPTGNRKVFNMSVDFTMIYPDGATAATSREGGGKGNATDRIMTWGPKQQLQVDKMVESVSLANPLHPPLPLPNHPVEGFSSSDSHQLCQLDTIPEESRSNYTSSSTSSSSTSKLTNLSRSSNVSACHYTEDEIVLSLKEMGIVNNVGCVNAFTSGTIGFMCQSIPVTNTPVHEISAPLPRVVCGSNATLGGSTYTVLKKLAVGGFATIFQAVDAQRPMKQNKVLKIQKPSCMWECAVVEELHKRLKANDLLHKSLCFMRVEQLNVYTDASVMVYNYYNHGTLLDLVNKAPTKFSRSMMLYYAVELLDIVGALHSCGIIHADIKPDNVMLRDIRPFTDISKAQNQGLCLIDFGRAIDVQSFPRGSKFTGSNKTDNFQCTQMLDNTPWTYQADLHCIAGTLHVLMFAGYMELAKDSSGQYRIKMNSFLSRRVLDRDLWNQLFSSLLNWNSNDVSQRPDISAIAKPLVDQLHKISNERFIHDYNNLWSTITK